MFEYREKNKSSQIEARDLIGAQSPRRHLAQDVEQDPLEQSIPALFERQVSGSPTRHAVKSGDQTLSFRTLNETANGIARDIIKLDGNGNEPVVLLLPPDAPLIAAIIGALKAGKICVPLRPTQPIARIREVLEHTGARIVLGNSVTGPIDADLEQSDCHVLHVEAIQPCSVDIDSSLTPDTAAYIFYTSGTTGAPRGVVHTHRTLLHLAMGSTDALRITCEDRIALMPSSSFIGAARSIFGALLSGASLHPFDVNKEGLARFAEWLADEQITIYHFVPTFFRHFVASLDGRNSFPKLRLVYLGGEPVRKADVDSFKKYFAPEAVLVNGYGATETGAIRRYFIDRHTPINDAMVPVGYPVADKEVSILDEAGHNLGQDQIGEIAVTSRYLSAGYWREPQATKLAFLTVSNEDKELLYRTGDLGRLSADGCLEHLGRKDSQVKIRGHRVNVAGLEKTLLEIPCTTDVAVVAQPDETGELRLIAYIASPATWEMTVSNMRSVLEKSLPSYSIPSRFVFIDAIPRTARGKLDKSALPEPLAERPNLDQTLVPARTSLERFLVATWADVLGIDEIGVNDGFFELGGDSLLATRILNRIQNKLDAVGERIYMTALFDSPTVAKLAVYLEHNYPAANFGSPNDHDPVNLPTPSRIQTPPEHSHIVEADLTRMRRLIASGYTDGDWGLAAKNPTIVFVLCSSRSGSTLLRVMLGGHPDLFAPPELRLLGYNTLAEREAAHIGENAMMLEGAMRAMMRISACSAAVALDSMKRLTSQGMTTGSFYRQLQDSIGTALLVDKTPNYALHLPTLARAETNFNEPYYIHLVRHPCGVIHSSEEIRLDLVSPYRKHASSASELAEMLWLISHQNILSFLKNIPAARQHRVRFEEVVQQPEASARELCKFLNLEFEHEMLRPYTGQSRKMTDGIHAETKMIGDIKFHEHRHIDPRAAERWKQHRSEDQLSDITRELAATLGYERS